MKNLKTKKVGERDAVYSLSLGNGKEAIIAHKVWVYENMNNHMYFTVNMN